MKSESKWEAESLRLTVFLAPSAVVPADRDWWVDVVGSQPDSKNIKPSRGELAEAGTFENNSLNLMIQPGRVDWMLSPHQSKLEDRELQFKLVGGFPSILDGFLPAMENWLKLCPPVTRLAFGTVLLEPVENKQAGYNRLAELLPSVKVDAQGSQDFLYQINRPRKSYLDGSLLNRLSKWSVSSYLPVSVTMAVGATGTSPVVYSSPGAQVFACRLELDLSTQAQTQHELPHERLGESFRELVNLGLEIATAGDIQ